MSTEGMFINGMWVVGKPSWWQQRRLKGRVKPYNWLAGSFGLLTGSILLFVIMALCVMYTLDKGVGPGKITLCLALIFCVGSAILVAVLGGPRRRTAYREYLIQQGKLLTPDDPAGQLVLFADMAGTVELLPPSAHDALKAPLADFAFGMATARVHFGGDKYWYLNPGTEQQVAWHNLSVYGESPLRRFCKAGEFTPRWVFDAVAEVLTEQMRQRRSDLMHKQAELCEGIKVRERILAKKKQELSEIEQKLAFDPAAILRTAKIS